MAEHPVMVVSGDEDYLVRRFLLGVVNAQRDDGWRILEVEGEDKSGLLTARSGNPFLGEMTLALVRHPEKMDLDLLKEHSQDKDPSTVFLLHIEGEPDGRTKFGKFVKAELAKVTHNFAHPPEHKAAEVALQFLLAEVKQRGKTLDPKLGEAMISRVGTDLGFLRFEVLKMCALADAAGTPAIGPPQVKGAMAPLAQAGLLPVLEALKAKDAVRLYRTLQHVKRTSKDDRTIQVCRFLGAAAQKWAAASFLDMVPPREAAAEVGQSPWEYTNLTLPGARSWGRKGSVALMQVTARAERALLQGASNAWLLLVSGLLAACQTYASAPR